MVYLGVMSSCVAAIASCASLYFSAKFFGIKENRFALATAFVGLISTVLVNLCATLTKYFFALVICLGLFTALRDLVRWSKNTKLFVALKKETVAVSLVCLFWSVFLNSKHFPGFLFKTDSPNQISSRFMNLDVLFRGALAGEILRTNSFSRMESPFYFPNKISTYHIGSESLTAFGEALIFEKWNVVTFASAHWIFLVMGLAILFFQSTKILSAAFVASSSFIKQNDFNQISWPEKTLLVTSTAFGLSLLGGLGRDYSLIAGANYNTPSWWGVFFLLTGIFAFWNKNLGQSLFLLCSSLNFKVSLAPTVLSLIAIWAVFNIRRLPLKKMALISSLPLSVFIMLFLLSKAETKNVPVAIDFRHSLDYDFFSVLDWSLHSIGRILLPVANHLPLKYRGFFLILFQIAGPILAIQVFRRLQFYWEKQKAVEITSSLYFWGSLLILCCGFPTLLFRTISPVHNFLDPWVNGLGMGWWSLAFIAALILTLFTSQNFNSKAIFSFVLIVLFALATRPDRVMTPWESFSLDKVRKMDGDVLFENDPLYAAFLGKRLHRSAENRFGFIVALKEE